MKVSINIADDDGTEVVVEIENREESRDRPEPPRNMHGEVVVPVLADDHKRIARLMVHNATDAALTALYGEGQF